ncbi:MAG: transglycosylase domain-containing protein, partial [Caldilineaceae bacterium]
MSKIGTSVHPTASIRMMNAKPTTRSRFAQNLPDFLKSGRFWLALIPLLLLGGWLALRLTILADLPSVDELESRLVRPTTRILDRNGRLLYEVLDPNAGKQIDLTADTAPDSRYGLAGIPDACVQATLATEDSRFFWHPGVDPIAIARALWQNWQADGAIVSGASTLTQQLARSLLMKPEERYVQSYDRKLREAVLALQLEQRYSKAQLLRLYLNQTYYGHFAFGLEAAAQNFFAKPAAQLSRAECALLAGLIQYPTGYDPFVDPESAKNRQLTVLRLMTDARFITQAESDQIAAEPLRYRSRLFAIEAPHFVMYIQDQLVRAVGVDRLRDGGLAVRTTLDLGLQRQAAAAVRRRLDQLNCRGQGQKKGATGQVVCDPGEEVARNGAAVVLDAASGEILAMVGNPNYFDESIQGNVNAVLSQRQPGSAIKPLTYAAALDPEWSRQAGVEPLTAASILADLPTAFPGGRGEEMAASNSFGDAGAYRPENYDLRYHGPVTVREALANSYNIPAVAVLQYIGVPTLQRIASAAGIGSFTGQYGLALTLGGGEVSLLDLTAAYGIFPRGGERLETKGILEIGDQKLGTGDMEAPDPRSPIPSPQSPVISPQTAFLITDILSDPIARLPAFGEGSVVELPFPAAAKTGTTTDWRDNWTVGFSSTRLVGVWVGNADNKPMVGVTGIDGAGPIWRDVMLAAHPTPPPAFSRPARIKDVTICAPSGLLPTRECPRLRHEYFIAGTEPTRPDDQFVRVSIDRATNQPANADTPAARISERIYWNLGPEYADWMKSQGIPRLEIGAWGAGNGDT